ncbi:hypothetical protein JL722_10884 [Aureococcus anophagefferens]|nr:hypothetical protein JL722_10884 [Aureococcus anophagefferens]
MLDSTADVLAAAVLATAGVSTVPRVLRGGAGLARARASDCTDTSFAPAGTEWKDDASAEDEGRSRKHLTSQIADEGGPATHQLVAATVIPDRSAARRGRAIATEPPRRRPRLRPAQLLIQFVVLPRKMGTGRDSLEHVGSSASLIHLRFDLLFKRDRGVLALRPRSRDAAPAAARWTALKIFSDSAGLYPMERVAEYGEKQVVRLAKEAANAAPRPRPNDDEVPPPSTDVPERDLLAAPSPPRASSAPAPAAPSPSALADASSPPPRGGRRLTSPEAAEPLEAAPPAPAPRRRAAASKKRVVDDADADDEDEAWEPGRPSMMDLDDDEQEQAAKAKRKLKRRSKKKSAKAKNAAGAAPHAPVSAPPARRRAARALDDDRAAATQPVPAPAAAAAPPRARCPRSARNCGELEVPRPREWALSELGDTMTTEAIRARFDLRRDDGVFFVCTAPGRAEVQIKELGFHFIDPLAPIAEKEIVRASALDDGHLIVELKYLQAMHVKNRMLKNSTWSCSRADAARVIRKFANAIARKAAEARGETFVPTPYDETAVDAVVVTAVPPVAPVVSAPAGPPLKALEGMDKKECNAELDAAGVPKAGRPKAASEILRDLVRRLRAGEPAASLKATLVADGAKKVVFQYGRPGNGTDYLVARWRGLAETDPLRLEFDELARRDVAAAAADELPVDRLQRVPDPGLMNLPTIWPRMRFPSASRLRPSDEGSFPRSGMCYRVIRDAKRRTSSSTTPRAEDDACPAYYGVDYREMRGALTCQFTVHEGTKTSGRKSAPADRRRSREALRSLENAFSEFMPERFYGINDRAKDGCPAGKVMALASIPGVAKAGDGCIVFGLYDSKVEVAPPRLERYKADFALQLKDLAYVEAADEAYLRDQAAALAPPEPMPDGSRPPIDAHSRRVARAGLANTFERMIERRRDRAAREREEAQARRRVACTSSAEFLSLFDESEVEMAAAMFDSRPIEIARPLLFESEEDAERRAEPAAPKRKRKSRKKRKAPAEAPAPAAAPAKKKKKKRSRRRGPAPPAEISEYERTRMRNIAAGNKKLYSLGLIHPPPEVVADPEHRGGPSARTRVFSRLRLTTRALPQAQS